MHRTVDAIASPTGLYTLDIGGFRVPAHAFDARDRIQALTGIEAWVVAASNGSAETHRVVLGIFSSQERAGAAAKTLLSTQTLSEASVVPLPKRSARQ